MFKRQSNVKLKQTAHTKRRRVLDPDTRMLIRQFLIGFIVFSLVALVLAGIWYGTRLQTLTLTTVLVEGGETISHDHVRRLVEDELTGTYLGFVPKRFVWLYPKVAVLEKVATVPRVKNPVIKRVSGTELLVSFEEYVPYALWCVDRLSETCLFFDNDGYAFSEAPRLTGGAFTRFHTLGTVPTIGTYILKKSTLLEVEKFTTKLSDELDFEVAFIETDSMMDVFYMLAGGGEIKATLRMSSDETFENLRSVLASPEFVDLAPGNFQYIDLRFGSKIFVNEEESVVATSTSLVPSENDGPPPTAATTPEQILPPGSPLVSTEEE